MLVVVGPPLLESREAGSCRGATPSGPWEIGTREALSCPRFPGAVFKWPESRRQASQMLLTYVLSHFKGSGFFSLQKGCD